MAAMSKEAAELEVTIPQYASQLETAKAPLLGALVAAWEAQPAPSGFTGAAAATPDVYDFSSMFPAPAEPVSFVSAPAVTPKNGKAIAGFVLSLLGISFFGLIFSILGLRQAREFESMDLRPVGRVLARWGVALSVISMVTSIGIGVLYVVMGPTILTALSPYIAQYVAP